MYDFETNIKSIQQFVNHCIDKGYSAYSLAFSVKRELLNPEQAEAATDKELEKVADELAGLLLQNPILHTLSRFIETGDFLWKSTFIEELSSLEKRKYASFDTLTFNAKAYMENPTRYDEALPYLSAVIAYGVLSNYSGYLKSLIPVWKRVGAENPVPVAAQTPETTLTTNEPQDLEANFDEEQIEAIADCLNSLNIFKTPVSVQTMGDIFSCKLKEPLQINRNKNKLLAYFFSALNNRSFITREWQSVCAKRRLFLSSGKSVVMQQGNFSSAVAQNNEFPPHDSHIIDKLMKQLKRN